MTLIEWPEREVHSTDYLGAAYSTVPPNFTGPVLLKLDNKASRTACFPSEAEGNLAASMAVGELGGYNRAVVVPAPEDACVTHPIARARSGQSGLRWLAPLQASAFRPG